MTSLRLFMLTSLAMLAFAANSLLCRLALRETAIDAATFTSVRLVSGAIALALIARSRGQRAALGGNWISAAALFTYAAAFSFAFRDLSAGTGALLSFCAVQTSMIFWGWRSGERSSWIQVAGILLALGGLVWLMFPKVSPPPRLAAASMLCAGLAWGVYSLRGRAAGDPLQETAGNFLRAVPLALLASGVFHAQARFDARGMEYALVSGALTSGVGYAVWYAALRGLDATRAATVQLSVPILVAVFGVLLLQEEPSARLALASLAILGGIALVIFQRRPVP